VRLLLDTHAVLWWLVGDERLPLRARTAISDSTNEIYVSAASAWEIATKVRIGKLPEAVKLAHDLAGNVAVQGFRELAVTVEHGQRAGLLPGAHKDPFDRMLIAQAQSENLVLVSNEEIFDDYSVVRLWD
jgi:PIN domain nuclease of toxin-antitoxin system